MEDPSRKIEREGGGWRLTLQRRTSDEAAEGSVLLRRDPGEGGSTHERLAAAAAWQSLAERALARGEAEAAAERALRGVEELGDEYLPPGTDDDTDLKLAAAAERLEAGAPGDAASVRLRVLADRMALYRRAHADELAG